MTKLKVIWSDFSDIQLDKIFKHYEDKASLNVALELIEGILKEPEILRDSPFVGQKEPLLSKRKTEYRYLVYKSFKIIYSVNEVQGEIKIVDVFDTRQFPHKIKRTQ